VSAHERTGEIHGREGEGRIGEHESVVRASRGARGPSYVVLTPGNRYASRLPNLHAALLFKLVTPRLSAARFGQYLLALEPGGGTSEPVRAGFEHFLYVLRGSVDLAVEGADEARLPAGGYCYLPREVSFGLSTAGGVAAELAWVKRRYEPWPGLHDPEPVFGHRDDAPFDADPALAGFRRRELLDPADPRYDFNMSLLSFDPGVGLAKVEVHDEEHGLLMTAGAGIYHLDGHDHAVEQDDFIYMAPYCPQSFLATGEEPAEYLLYKDVYRDGF
jgi:(S)-ureidoglycine aminohydrolase